MLTRDKDLSHGPDNCQSTLPRRVSDQNLEIPQEKIGFPEKGIEFLRESGMGRDGFQSKPLKIGTSGSQELTLSYLCDPSKLGFSDKELPGKNYLNSLEKVSFKGKEVITEDPNQEERWVERDFLNLNEVRGNPSKRDIEEEAERETREKKPKLETLNLSLALPDVSLSLTASNPVQNAGPPVRPRPSRSIQSVEPSNNNTQTTCSNDFTAASLSYSYSHPFSHNPSCSLTRNSTENYEYSVGRDADQIWNCGEGTNGSVHSRFKPIGDGVALANQGGGGGYPLMQGSRMINKEPCNSLHRAASSENQSFFPSDLPARPRIDTQSGDSRGKGSEHLRGLENLDGGRTRKLSRPERILREIVSESVSLMAQIIQELHGEIVESIKEYLKNIIAAPEKEELVDLQNRLERRSDLTVETLSKCHKDQLDIFVAVKMGLGNFLFSKNRLSNTELIEIFLFTRCRNVNCKALLPVDDCDCKICSANKGFCRECMCPVCMKFDCANNTCSWVGCDLCSHWCHAACGIQKNLIKPGPSLKGPSGTTEMQFHCIGCSHPSEMFGFVKDVFICCAEKWDRDVLIKELDYVRKIFRGSEDYKGKELQNKAEDMLCKLESKMISPSDACKFIIQFFKYTDGMSDFPAPSVVLKDSSTVIQGSLRKDAAPLPPPASLSPKSSLYKMTSTNLQRDLLLHDLRQNDLKISHIGDRKTDEEFRFGKSSNKDVFDSLESIVRMKEAEARMFQNRADEAQREAEGYRRMVHARTEKLEEEYTEKLAKLCLQETEERRRKKLEELKTLENSHCDYYNMKMRMQAEIAGLLERMEATKQQWV